MAEPVEPPETITLHEGVIYGEAEWATNPNWDSAFKLTGRTETYVRSSKLSTVLEIVRDAERSGHPEDYTSAVARIRDFLVERQSHITEGVRRYGKEAPPPFVLPNAYSGNPEDQMHAGNVKAAENWTEKNGQHIHETLTASLHDANAALMTVAKLLGVGDVGLEWKERLVEKAKEAKGYADRLEKVSLALGEVSEALVKSEGRLDAVVKGLQAWFDGDFPHPRSFRGTTGKCPHDVYYYKDCDACNTDHLEKVLALAKGEVVERHDSKKRCGYFCKRCKTQHITNETPERCLCGSTEIKQLYDTVDCYHVWHKDLGYCSQCGADYDSPRSSTGESK